MLSPEVWNFKPPNQYKEINFGDLSAKNCETNFNNLTYSHYFNRMISVSIGNTNEVPKEVIDVLNDSDSYIVNDVLISEFVKKPFLESFIKKGEFYAISYNTKIDTDECIAISPLGKLILSLNKETYQSLGLEGSLSYFSKTTKDRYVVKINLYKPEENTTYDRLLAILSSDILSRFNIQLTWRPNNLQICASSVAKYFSDLDYTVELYKTKSKIFSQENVQLFDLRLPNDNRENLINSFIEWIGMLTLECNLQFDSYLNSYKNDENMVVADKGHVGIATWKGMFSCKEVNQIIIELHRHLKNNPNIPWISIYVHGFEHSPVSFNLKEHNFITNGNNSYTIILSQTEKKFVSYKILSSNKILKKKSK